MAQVPRPTPAELELLQALWDLGPSTARQVHEHLAPRRPDLTQATVLRFLQIMHGKGLLTRDERQRSHVYAPGQARDSHQRNLLSDFIHRAFSGSGKELVLAALQGDHVTDSEREEIRAFLSRQGGRP